MNKNRSIYLLQEGDVVTIIFIRDPLNPNDFESRNYRVAEVGQNLVLENNQSKIIIAIKDPANE